MVEIMERIRPRRKAHQKLAIKNPGTIEAVSITSPAFITNVKRPIERKLMGSVSKISMGFKIAFTRPKTSAADKAAKKLFTETPGRI